MALKEGTVTAIAASASLKEAFAEAQRAGYKNPTMTYIPKELVHYAGGFRLVEN